MLKKTYLGDKEFLKWTLRLGFPSVIQMLLAVSVNALNNMLTGRYFGHIEMSAVALAATVFSIFEVITYGFSSSCGVLTAQYWGKNDKKTIHDVIAITVRFELLLGLVVGAVMLFAPKFVMGIMSSDAAVVEIGSRYLQISAPNYFLFGMVSALYSVYRSVEMVQLVFWGNTLCYGVNLALSFVLLPKYGIYGAAVASVVARVIDFIFVVYCLLRNKQLGFSAKCLANRNRALMGSYMQVLYPIMGHELIWSVGNNMISIIMGNLDTVAHAGYSIAYTLFSILTSLSGGLGTAAGAIVGKSIGEGDKEKARISGNTFVAYTAIVGAFSTLLMLVIRPLFLSFYNLDDPQILAYANGMLLILSVVIFFNGFDSVVLVTTLRAGGMGKIGFYTDIVVMWMIGIPLGWLAAYKWHLNPMWIVALVKIDMPLKSILGTYFVLFRDWIRNLTTTESSEETASEAL